MKNLKFNIAVLVLVGVAAFGMRAAQEVSLDMNFLAVGGDLSQAQRTEILNTLVVNRLKIKELGDIKRILEAREWIDKVDVARHWPDRIEIKVSEEQAIAYWNDDAFVNDKGKVFTSPYLVPGDLAHLYGPDSSEREVMQQYHDLTKALTQSAQSIEVLVFDERGAWEFTTGQGVKVLIGKDNIMERIQRFLLVVERGGLYQRLDDIEQIDTRYSNGIAVDWKDSQTGLSLANTNNSQRELRL
ncbi:MAG: cell division protein FtsQ/DivIB [Pseudomonadales bacterium]